MTTGCLGQTKQLMTVNDDGTQIWNSQVAGVSTNTLWWQKTTVGVDNNPWECFVKPQRTNSWHNPWAQPDPVLNVVEQRPRVKAVRVERRVITKQKVYVVPSDRVDDFLEKFPEFRKRLYKGEKKIDSREEVY